MRVVRGPDPSLSGAPTAVAVGTFDGVHVGHQALIRSAVQTARACLIRSAVLTFDRHPLETLDPARAPRLLDTQDQRERHISELGVDIAVVLPFDEALRSMTPERFIEEVLIGRMQAATVHIGEGFTFGRDRRGTVALLQQMGMRMGYAVSVLPPVMVGDAPASSSRVRAMLEAGDVEGAAEVLGRPFELAGTVVTGDQIGRQLGFPTANLQCQPRQAVPADGVYATAVDVDGTTFAGACSIGNRPTLGGTQRVIEVHLVGFDGDLYGRRLELAFLRRLRAQARYDGNEALVAQIARDVADTAATVARHCRIGP